ncbi:MAG: hypothetical protein H6734_19005 [Alphaproteobacteria bacterium]|nr:hypothetical protein [Alphaproteobacteria bacterium]
MTPPPLPLHLLVGDSRALDVALRALPAVLVAARWLAVPVAVGVGGIRAVPAVVALVGVLLWSRSRPDRSCASPLAEEAVGLLGCAAIAAASGGGGSAVLAGALAGLTAWGLALLALFAAWGRRPSAITLRRPWFRVLGDNPAARTHLFRVRPHGPLDVDLPRAADGPVSAVLYDLALRPVARVSWEDLRPSYLSGGARVTLEVPPGRYLLSVRAYRPWAGGPEPRVLP